MEAVGELPLEETTTLNNAQEIPCSILPEETGTEKDEPMDIDEDSVNISNTKGCEDSASVSNLVEDEEKEDNSEVSSNVIDKDEEKKDNSEDSSNVINTGEEEEDNSEVSSNVIDTGEEEEDNTPIVDLNIESNMKVEQTETSTSQSCEKVSEPIKDTVDMNTAECVATESESINTTDAVNEPLSNEIMEAVSASDKEIGKTNIASCSIEDNQDNAVISPEEVEASCDNPVGSGLTENLDGETKLRYEQNVDDKEELVSETKQLSEDKNEMEKDSETTDQAESIENVQKYIDETSQEEMSKENSSSDMPTQSADEVNKDIQGETDISQNDELKESLLENPVESEETPEDKTHDENSEDGVKACVAEEDIGKETSPPSEVSESPKVESPSARSDGTPASSTPNVLMKRVYRKRRNDPVMGQPLSLSKLYHLEAEFKGFLSEYYDSTIFMYRSYWSYVQEEFGIEKRPLPKYKSNLYTSQPAASATPVVHTSSGRIVKRKEMKEFTPSVPSSHQIKKEKESLVTSKKESPVVKKEKKDPTEESSRQKYRVPLEKFGWKREVVFRGHSDNKHSADVYYYTPANKKLRSLREIVDYLPEGGDLKPFHFSFVKELLGYGSPLEISREAFSRTLTNDEDTPKRNKTSPGVPRKAFSNFVTNKTDPIKVLNGKTKKLPLTSSAVKRPHESSESEDESSESSPEKLAPTKHSYEKKVAPSNGELLKSKLLSPLTNVKSPADVKHRKLSGVKGSNESKKRADNSQSENKVPNSLGNKHKSDSLVKTSSVKKRKLDAVSTQDAEREASLLKQALQPVASPPVLRITHNNKNLINDVSNQFNALVHLCKYLRVEDLLRVARVNRMFNAAAHAHLLWQVVKLKNSKVRDWNGLADCLIRHGTHTLDMLKMIGSTDPDENDEIWNRFYKVIGKIHSLKRLELGRVTAAEILNAASNCSKNLTEFSVIAQKLATIDLKLFQGLPNLEILQLRSFESKREHGLIMMNIPMLAHMRNLRHLSLTGVKNLKSYQVNVFKDFPPLTSLELGDCTKLDDRFPEASLAHLTSLVRLRLEMVQGNMANKFVEVIATLPRLSTLELINIDTKKGFDDVFGRLSRVEHVLIFPTYITQSSTTNWLVLSGLAKLKNSLRFLTWGLTQELLRVTTLFIEQWNAQLNLDEGVSKLNPEELKKTIVESNSIPVMKPLPELFEAVHSAGKTHSSGKQNISELDILPIDELKSMLEKVLCDTKIKLITVPVSSTTRIYLPNN